MLIKTSLQKQPLADALQILQKRKAPVRSLFFGKVDLRPGTLSKKRLCH